MAEFYAHERLAKAAAQSMTMDPMVYENFSAYLVGSNGPDPMFFRVLWRFEGGGMGVQKLGARLHDERCGRFVRELVDQANTPAQRAYALGFLCHYALDQVIHPYVRWQCRPGGDFSMEGGHGYLEEAIDSALYCKDNPKAGSLEPPVMELGVFLVEPRAEEEIDELLRTACSGVCRPEEVKTLVLAGNTTMLYLWSGRDPVSLSAAPFAADCLFGQTVEAQGRSAVLPPCMNAFVGADITCAVLASGLAESDRVAVLCDIGTNGEIALWKGGELLVTSTAAGPAFEGAGISCGCGSVPGAVDRVWLENGRIAARTIGGQAAVGVCGSGLIDAVAAYLQTGDIDETGATEEDTLPLRDGVALLPKDVRAVQLAKAAIAAGLETLLRNANLAPEDVDDLYIAGGFGSHLHIPSAVTIGLLPAALAAKARAIGNASLEGASRLLLSREEGEKARGIAARSRHVALGGNPMFNERYIENMMFESSDCD